MVLCSLKEWREIIIIIIIIIIIMTVITQLYCQLYKTCQNI